MIQFLMCSNVVRIKNIEHLRRLLQKYNPELLSCMKVHGNKVGFSTFDNFKAQFIPYSRFSGKLSEEENDFYMKKFRKLIDPNDILLFYETRQANDIVIVVDPKKGDPFMAPAHAILHLPHDQIRELFKNC